MTEEKKETVATEKSNKFNSRKFIVWSAATVFELGAIILAFIIKDGTVAQTFTPWWGAISTAYIGGNVAQKFVTAKTTTETESDKES